MLWQIQQTQDIMRLSVQQHMERKYNVSENIVIPQQMMINNNSNNGEFLYSAHTMLCALHTYHPWSLDLFIQIPFKLPF